MTERTLTLMPLLDYRDPDTAARFNPDYKMLRKQARILSLAKLSKRSLTPRSSPSVPLAGTSR